MDTHFKAKLQCTFCHKTRDYKAECLNTPRQASEGEQKSNGPPKIESGGRNMDQGGKKRRFETISFLGQPFTLYLDTSIGGHRLSSVIDTGAAASAVSSRFSGAVHVERGTALPVNMGDGGIVFSQGTA